jgi:hypothetical protein
VIHFWNSMVGLGRGPDRRAPAAKVSSLTIEFRGTQSSLQGWSHIMFGFDGLRPSSLRRCQRWAALGGCVAGTPKGFNVNLSFLGYFLHLCGSSCVLVPSICVRTCPVFSE